jgi:hypothetical protein
MLNVSGFGKLFWLVPPVMIYSTLLVSAHVSNDEEVDFRGGNTYEADSATPDSKMIVADTGGIWFNMGFVSQ